MPCAGATGATSPQPGGSTAQPASSTSVDSPGRVAGDTAKGRPAHAFIGRKPQGAQLHGHGRSARGGRRTSLAVGAPCPRRHDGAGAVEHRPVDLGHPHWRGHLDDRLLPDVRRAGRRPPVAGHLHPQRRPRGPAGAAAAHRPGTVRPRGVLPPLPGPPCGRAPRVAAQPRARHLRRGREAPGHDGLRARRDGGRAGAAAASRQRGTPVARGRGVRARPVDLGHGLRCRHLDRAVLRHPRHGARQLRRDRRGLLRPGARGPRARAAHGAHRGGPSPSLRVRVPHLPSRRQRRLGDQSRAGPVRRAGPAAVGHRHPRRRDGTQAAADRAAGSAHREQHRHLPLGHAHCRRRSRPPCR